MEVMYHVNILVRLLESVMKHFLEPLNRYRVNQLMYVRQVRLVTLDYTHSLTLMLESDDLVGMADLGLLIALLLMWISNQQNESLVQVRTHGPVGPCVVSVRYVPAVLCVL